MFSKKEFAIISHLRFISSTKFHAQLSWARKHSIISGPDLHNIKAYTKFSVGIKHGFSCINIRKVPWEVLKTDAE